MSNSNQQFPNLPGTVIENSLLDTDPTIFNDLPTDVLLHMFNFLSLQDLHNIGTTNTYYNQIIKINDFWHARFETHFPNEYRELKQKPIVNWLKEFKDQYQYIKEKYKLDNRAMGILSCLKEKRFVDLGKVGLKIKDFENTIFSNWLRTRTTRDDHELLNAIYNAIYNGIKNNIEDPDIVRLPYWAIYCQVPKEELLLKLDMIQDCNSTSEFQLMGGKKYTPLQFAAQCNNLLAVEQLIQKKVDINLATSAGNSPLHLAIQNDRPEVAKLLINNGANLEAVNHSGSTPLLIAAQYSKKCFDLLIKNPSFSKLAIDALDTNQQSILHKAALGGQLDIIKQLDTNKFDQLNKPDAQGNSLIHLAVKNGHLDVIKYLIDVKKLDVNVFNNEGKTPLHFAVQKQKLKDIEFLLANNADTHLLDAAGHSPLYTAAETQQPLIFKTVFDKDKTLTEIESEEVITILTTQKEIESEEGIRILSTQYECLDHVLTNMTRALNDREKDKIFTIFLPIFHSIVVKVDKEILDPTSFKEIAEKIEKNNKDLFDKITHMKHILSLPNTIALLEENIKKMVYETPRPDPTIRAMLYFAIRHDCYQLIRMVKDIDPKLLHLNRSFKHGLPLEYALLNNDKTLIDLLLEAGANANWFEKENKFRQLAVKDKHTNVIIRLIENYLNKRDRDPDNFSSGLLNKVHSLFSEKNQKFIENKLPISRDNKMSAAQALIDVLKEVNPTTSLKDYQYALTQGELGVIFKDIQPLIEEIRHKENLSTQPKPGA